MIAEALARFELAHEATFLAPFAGFELALVPAAGEPASRSRIGGGVELAHDVAWPSQRWPLAEVASWPDFARDEATEAIAGGLAREENGELVMPLSFLCQLDLADVPRTPESARLPASGLLAFFASITTDIPDPRFAKRVASAVLYAPDGAELVHTEQPPTPDPYPSQALSLRVERRLYAELPWEELQGMRQRTDPAVMQRFEAEVCNRGDALLPCPTSEAVGPMPPPGQIALARIMEHHELELFIGDASWVTFCVPEADLAALRFENAGGSVYVG